MSYLSLQCHSSTFHLFWSEHHQTFTTCSAAVNAFIERLEQQRPEYLDVSLGDDAPAIDGPLFNRIIEMRHQLTIKQLCFRCPDVDHRPLEIIQLIAVCSSVLEELCVCDCGGSSEFWEAIGICGKLRSLSIHDHTNGPRKHPCPAPNQKRQRVPGGGAYAKIEGDAVRALRGKQLNTLVFCGVRKPPHTAALLSLLDQMRVVHLALRGLDGPYQPFWASGAYEGTVWGSVVDRLSHMPFVAARLETLTLNYIWKTTWPSWLKSFTCDRVAALVDVFPNLKWLLLLRLEETNPTPPEVAKPLLARFLAQPLKRKRTVVVTLCMVDDVVENMLDEGKCEQIWTRTGYEHLRWMTKGNVTVQLRADGIPQPFEDLFYTD